jgi:hypothetical protein
VHSLNFRASNPQPRVSKKTKRAVSNYRHNQLAGFRVPVTRSTYRQVGVHLVVVDVRGHILNFRVIRPVGRNRRRGRLTGGHGGKARCARCARCKGRDRNARSESGQSGDAGQSAGSRVGQAPHGQGHSEGEKTKDYNWTWRWKKMKVRRRYREENNGERRMENVGELGKGKGCQADFMPRVGYCRSDTC